MSSTQKTIKYIAIAFGIFLAVNIIGGILIGISSLFGALLGIEFLNNEVGESTITNFVQSYEQVEKLDIELSVSRFKIVEGDKFQVEASNTHKRFEVKQEGNKLKIKEKVKKIGILQGNNVSSDITLTIPKGTILKDVKIKTGVGNTTIEALNTEDLDLEVGVGKLSGKQINAKNCDLKGGVGVIDLQQVQFGKLELQSGVGECILSGKISENAEIEGGIGKIELSLIGNEDTYYIKAKTGIGSIHINDKKYEDKETYGNGNSTITLKGGIGPIQVLVTSEI